MREVTDRQWNAVLGKGEINGCQPVDGFVARREHAHGDGEDERTGWILTPRSRGTGGGRGSEGYRSEQRQRGAPQAHVTV